jgi:hypothetical protein
VFLLYEAFVSGAAHDRDNDPVRDAATAASFFLENEGKLGAINAVTAAPCISLAWAAALWAGWVTDLAGLANGLLVVRPAARYDGPLGVIG